MKTKKELEKDLDDAIAYATLKWDKWQIIKEEYDAIAKEYYEAYAEVKLIISKIVAL